jgi:hypothetical protein
MKLAAAGLIPIFPVIVVAPIVVVAVMAVSPRIAKLLAVPRFTVAGPAASAELNTKKPLMINIAATTKKENLKGPFPFLPPSRKKLDIY